MEREPRGTGILDRLCAEEPPRRRHVDRVRLPCGPAEITTTGLTVALGEGAPALPAVHMSATVGVPGTGRRLVLTLTTSTLAAWRAYAATAADMLRSIRFEGDKP